MNIRSITAHDACLLAAFGATFPSCSGMEVETFDFDRPHLTGYHLHWLNNDENAGGSVEWVYETPNRQRMTLISATSKRRYVLTRERGRVLREARVEFGERGSASAASDVLSALADALSAVVCTGDDAAEIDVEDGTRVYNDHDELAEVVYVDGTTERVSITRMRAIALELDAQVLREAC